MKSRQASPEYASSASVRYAPIAIVAKIRTARTTRMIVRHGNRSRRPIRTSRVASPPVAVDMRRSLIHPETLRAGRWPARGVTRTRTSLGDVLQRLRVRVDGSRRLLAALDRPVGVLEEADRDVGGAVAERRARDETRDAFVPARRQHGVLQRGPGDQQRPAVLDRDLLDRLEQDARGVKRVGVEDGRRRLAELVPVRRYELVPVERAFLEHRQVRGGRVVVARRTSGELEERALQTPVRADLDRLRWEDVRALGVRERANGVEVGPVHHAGVAFRDASENGAGVLVRALNLLDGGDRPAETLERVAERRGEAVGVGALVVDGRRRVDAQLVEDELGDDRALDQVVVRGARVERLVRLLRREPGVGVGRREGKDPSVREDRVGHAERRARARRADDGNDRLVCRERRAAGLTALGRAAVVLLGHLDVALEDLAGRPVERAVQVVDRQLHSAVAVGPESRGRARDRQKRRQVDRLALRVLDAAELVLVARCSSAAVTVGAGAVAVVVRTRGGDEGQRCEERQQAKEPALPHEPPPSSRSPATYHIGRAAATGLSRISTQPARSGDCSMYAGVPQDGTASRNAPAIRTAASRSPPSRCRTSALPTTTPSANRHASAACSGVPIPTPINNGRSVSGRSASTTCAAIPDSASRSPVTPYVATQYTNPAATPAIARRRWGLVPGASRNTGATPADLHAAATSSASSTGRSGTMTPATPASAASSRKALTP